MSSSPLCNCLESQFRLAVTIQRFVTDTHLNHSFLPETDFQQFPTYNVRRAVFDRHAVIVKSCPLHFKHEMANMGFDSALRLACAQASLQVV